MNLLSVQPTRDYICSTLWSLAQVFPIHCDGLPLRSYSHLNRQDKVNLEGRTSVSDIKFDHPFTSLSIIHAQASKHNSWENSTNIFLCF